jgi:hypothetical protein
MIATERLYLTGDRSRVVREGDPSAAFLLVAKGCFIPTDVAAKYGLLQKTEEKPQQAASEEPAANPRTRKTRVPERIQTRE